MYTTIVIVLLLIGHVCAGWTVVRKLSRGGRWEHDNDCRWSSPGRCECGMRRLPTPGMTLWMWPLVLTSIAARAGWGRLIGSAVVESKQTELKRREKAVEDMERELGL